MSLREWKEVRIMPRAALLKMCEQSVGHGAAERVVHEVNIDWLRPGQRNRSSTPVGVKDAFKDSSIW
jgi:hypothetical protein